MLHSPRSRQRFRRIPVRSQIRSSPCKRRPKRNLLMHLPSQSTAVADNSAGRDVRPIGVFDSGIGGLTVVSALRRALPNESIYYLGDTARVPYGGEKPTTP